MEWSTYGGDYWNRRYSPLNSINARNVGQLVPRMVFQTGISKLGSFENTPIVADGIMYVTTPYNTAIAYDLKTKKQLWRYEHKLGTTIYCCGPSNRGVGIHGPHLYMGTLDGRLVALNRKDGSVLWDIEVGDPAHGYSITQAPLVIGDNVIVGASGGEYGIRGYVTAYNAVDGKQVWRWYSIPAPKGDPTFDDKAPNGWWGTWPGQTPDGANLHRDVAKEKADSAKYADTWSNGGGGVWMTPAYDPESNTIYVAVGNPSPDLDGGVRPGDNLYTDCIVAIDATDGKTKWYYQTVPHDVWDLDAVSPPVVTKLGNQKVVVHAGKTAWVYVLDAATGKLVRRTDNFTPQENMFALPTERGTRMLPGANGGSEWSPISVDPTLNYAFVAGLHQPMHYFTHTAPYEKGRLWLGSAFVAIAGEEQYGLFSAVNLSTGKIAWQNKVPQPMMGGALSTAGGLTFTGEGNGNFNAYDSKSGKPLWQFNAGAGCNSAPMTFEFEGEQLVAVACGGNFQISYPLGEAVLVFGLSRGYTHCADPPWTPYVEEFPLEGLYGPWSGKLSGGVVTDVLQAQGFVVRPGDSIGRLEYYRTRFRMLEGVPRRLEAELALAVSFPHDISGRRPRFRVSSVACERPRRENQWEEALTEKVQALVERIVRAVVDSLTHAGGRSR